jgi:hypothetical protein
VGIGTGNENEIFLGVGGGGGRLNWEGRWVLGGRRGKRMMMDNVAVMGDVMKDDSFWVKSINERF